MALAVGGFTALYVGSYAALSLNGAYAPGVWGLARNGGWRVKWFDWQPAGFYDPTKGIQSWISNLYAPLLTLDREHWHTSRIPEPWEPQHPSVFPKLK
jgi:hypothetical protein